MDTHFEEGKVITVSPYGGTLYRLVKDHGHLIDYIHIMAYDVGPTYNPREGYASYRAIYDGNMTIGRQIPPGAVNGSVLTI